MAASPFELSDCLGELHRYFRDDMAGGFKASAQSAGLMAELFRQLWQDAVALEDEVQLRRWNERSLRERDVDPVAVVAAACAPGSNVVLFAQPERPFDDGPWTGGAA